MESKWIILFLLQDSPFEKSENENMFEPFKTISVAINYHIITCLSVPGDSAELTFTSTLILNIKRNFNGRSRRWRERRCSVLRAAVANVFSAKN